MVINHLLNDPPSTPRFKFEEWISQKWSGRKENVPKRRQNMDIWVSKGSISRGFLDIIPPK